MNSVLNKKLFTKVNQKKLINIRQKNNSDFISFNRESNLKIFGLVDDQTTIKQIVGVENNKIPTKIYSLGGIEEIGKNMYCLEHDDEIVIIDAGIKFANKKKMPGISGIIPSVKHLKENEKKIVALIITHGHEDHIGGVPYILKQIKIPTIYCSSIASELIKRKTTEHKVNDQFELKIYSDKSVINTKHFLIDFYRVNHSIPDSFGVSFATINGLLVHSGDFRFDFNSEGDKFDLQKISQIATRGVDVLLCESTNAEYNVFNQSESVVINEIYNIISSSMGRVIITSFSSNLGRVEKIMKVAVNLNRKIIILGRSMENNINASMNVGYLKVKDNFIFHNKIIKQFPDNEILILCTGSQGEETAALNSIAWGRHSWATLKSTDTVILSSNVILGNYLAVETMVNQIYKSGAKVYLNTPDCQIHSSGHASKLEQQLFFNLIMPKYLIPIHGEYKMINNLIKNVVDTGFNKENAFVLKNGQVLHLLNKKLSYSDEFVDAREIYIDAHNITLTDSDITLKRQALGIRGFVVIHIYLDLKNKIIHNISPISNVGSFYLSNSIEWLKKLISILFTKLRFYFKENKEPTIEGVKKTTANFLSEQILKQKNKNPIIEVITTDQLFEDLFKCKIKS